MADSNITLKHRLEYAALRFFQVSLGLLPLRAAYALAEAKLFLIQEVFGWRKAETTRRMQQVFPEKTEKEIGYLRRAAARNLADNLVEIARSDRLGAQWRKSGRSEHVDVLKEMASARHHGKGLIMVIAHSGNWDLAALYASCSGVPICFIARKQKNPLTYQALIGAREQGGGSVIDRDDPRLLQKVIAHLKANEVVAILVDIRARGEGEAFQFLGQPCRLSNGLGLIAARSGAPLLPVAIHRNEQRDQVWTPLPLKWLEPPGKKPQRTALLQSVLDELGASILSHPESYFWYNKRWVLEI